MSGVITGPYFRKYFNDPTAIEVGTMVAVLEVGAFGQSTQAHCHPLIERSSERYTPHTATSLAAGRIGDGIGRRGTLFSGAVIFAIGGAIQTFTTGFWVMVFGRIISGLGVGLLS